MMYALGADPALAPWAIPPEDGSVMPSPLEECDGSGHAGKQRVPRAMVLRAVDPRAGEVTSQHAQLTHLVESN